MRKQNQIIAIEKGVKTRAEKTLTDVHHRFQKHDLLMGLSRTYTPKNEDGEQLPTERKLVQVRAQDQIQRALEALREEYDVTATKEWTNSMAARADVKVDGEIVLADVPVTFLLFLEKQLTRLMTFISKMPVLDPSEKWDFDPNKGCYVTEPTETVRTQKVQEPIVMYDATPEHPAQTQLISKDVQIGTYKLVKMCGALPFKEVSAMAKRVDILMKAVKVAREEANACEAVEKTVGENVLQFIFGNNLSDAAQ